MATLKRLRASFFIAVYLVLQPAIARAQENQTSTDNNSTKQVHDFEDKQFTSMTWPHFRSFVVVGDSFATGPGALKGENYVGGPLEGDASSSGKCQRNKGSWPYRLYKLLKPDVFKFLACSGHDFDQIRTEQVSGPEFIISNRTGTDLIMIIGGGNENSSFGNILRGCVVKPSEASCDKALQGARTAMDSLLLTLFMNLRLIKFAEVYSGKLEIVFMGYPTFYNEDAPKEQCPLKDTDSSIDLSWATPGLDGYRHKINKLIRDMNDVIKRTAELLDITFVDVDPFFEGHRFCDGPENAWLQSKLSLFESGAVTLCHPTFEGHGAYIGALMNNFKRRLASGEEIGRNRSDLPSGLNDPEKTPLESHELALSSFEDWLQEIDWKWEKDRAKEHLLVALSMIAMKTPLTNVELDIMWAVGVHFGFVDIPEWL